MSDLCNLLILIPNYNSEKYIKKCLDSIISQKTQYKYKILINDDCSTDNCLEIIKEYELNYPETVIVFKNLENKNTLKTSNILYEKINTQFFTVLDPDDYWIDELFIERGINFLLNNNEYYVYGENTKLLNLDTNVITNMHNENIEIGGIDKNNYKYLIPHTSSTIFRGNFDDNILNKLENIHLKKLEKYNLKTIMLEHIYEGDTFRNIYFSLKGKMYCNYNFYAGCYTLRNNSQWAMLDNILKNILNAYCFLKLSKLTEINFCKNYLLELSYNFYKNIFKEKLNTDKIYNYRKQKIDNNQICNIIKKIGKKLNNCNKLIDVNNHFLFFIPSKFIGGLEMFFIKMAINLYNDGFKISYIDYENGHFKKIITDKNLKINFIKFPDLTINDNNLLKANYIIKHNDNVNLIMPFTMSKEVKIQLSKKSKIIYYFAHPNSFEFLIARGNITKKKAIEHCKIINKNIFCQDIINQKNLNNIISNNNILPIFIEKNNFSDYNSEIINKNEINIGWLSRLDYDKIFALINIMDNLVAYKTDKKKILHIIGDGDSKNLINFNHYKENNVELKFTGLLLENDKLKYLVNNVDIFFGMGISLIESASCKIPSILVLCQQNHKYIPNKFIYVHNLKDYNNGLYEDDLKYFNHKYFDFNTFEDIINNIYINENKKYIGELSYKYYLNNHTYENTFYHLIKGLINM